MCSQASDKRTALSPENVIGQNEHLGRINDNVVATAVSWITYEFNKSMRFLDNNHS